MDTFTEIAIDHVLFSGSQRRCQTPAKLFIEYVHIEFEPERFSRTKRSHQDADNRRLCFRCLQLTLPRAKNVAISVIQLSRRHQLQRPIHTINFPRYIFQFWGQPFTLRLSIEKLQKVRQ